LKYSKEHIWARLDDDNHITIGVSEFAQEELGEIIHIDLPGDGDEVFKDEPFGVIESNKTITELYSPISGEVIEVNHDVIDNPELINEDALSDGWLIRVEPSSDGEFSELLVPEEYEEYLKEDIEEFEEEE
ncbi:MAG: glycine cleavage system protein GcvH, partial [Deltaproteobacteria bacterium]|nr:glycine cleavage system protein GcvH [Deltaproteobacteria bacterium]